MEALFLTSDLFVICYILRLSVFEDFCFLIFCLDRNIEFFITSDYTVAGLFWLVVRYVTHIFLKIDIMVEIGYGNVGLYVCTIPLLLP
jgi:hypothetical protein